MPKLQKEDGEQLTWRREKPTGKGPRNPTRKWHGRDPGTLHRRKNGCGLKGRDPRTQSRVSGNRETEDAVERSIAINGG